MSAEAATGLARLLLSLPDPALGEDLLLDAISLNLHHESTPPPATLVVVEGEDATFARLEGGGLRVSRALFWSLLWPEHAARLTAAGGEKATAPEAWLKEEGDSVRRRLAHWAGIDPQRRDSWTALMRRYAPGSEALTSTLDRLAAGQAPAADGPDDAPAKPVETKAPEGLEDVGRWLTDEEGFGRLYGADFVPRAEQGRLAREAAAALAGGQALLSEAGTGVGKTLAYLAPLLILASEKGRRALVSTHTRALQRQILENDFPLLATLWPGLKARLLMGRSNYLCARPRGDFLARPISSAQEAWQRVALEVWLAETREGMREELTDHPLLAKHLRSLFDDNRPCSPHVCYGGTGCYVQRARKRAREADLLVVNHALLMHDRQAGGALLGAYDLLVVDEAHRLPQVALDAHAIVADRRRPRRIAELFGERIRGTGLPPVLAALAKQLGGSEPEQAEAAASVAELAAGMRAFETGYAKWWTALAERFASSEATNHRTRIYDKDEAFGAVRAETARLLETAGRVNRDFARVARRAEVLADLSAGAEENLANLAQAGAMLGELERDLHFLTHDPDEDWVTWHRSRAEGGLTAIGATRLEAGPLLKEFWHGDCPAPVMVSATLTVAGDFGHMLGELGLTGRRPQTRCVLLDSPFDYDRIARFLVPTDLPAPGSPDYAGALCRVLLPVLERAPRKSMILFTSYSLLGTVAAGLERDGGDRMPLLLRQRPQEGVAPLLQRFRGARRAALLGTSTFWEGVDFPGRDLELLIVTKLPFAVPSDPWVEARCERVQAGGDNPFTEFMVRDAVLRLRQGVGRLIRRSTDRGVVLLLDSRLHAKPYGLSFLNSLPGAAAFCLGDETLARNIATFLAGDLPPDSKGR